jgi:hypothetical protein
MTAAEYISIEKAGEQKAKLKDGAMLSRYV